MYGEVEEIADVVPFGQLVDLGGVSGRVGNGLMLDDVVLSDVTEELEVEA